MRLRCLDDTGGASRWTLAAVGANARRAAEDSAAVAYIGEPEAAAARFSAPILESAEIPRLPGPEAGAAMETVLDALRKAGGEGGLREAVGAAITEAGR